MRIKMLTLAAGPGGVYQPGFVFDLSDEAARALIAGGYAVEVPAAAVSLSPPSPSRKKRGKRGTETAAVEPPESREG